MVSRLKIAVTNSADNSSQIFYIILSFSKNFVACKYNNSEVVL